MKPYTWSPDHTPEEVKNGAYWERNMLALYMANHSNNVWRQHLEAMGLIGQYPPCGWYFDTDNNWEGWKRVISLFDGQATFHIPDDFDIGTLPEIELNWDGHTTEEKWLRIMKRCGCE